MFKGQIYVYQVHRNQTLDQDKSSKYAEKEPQRVNHMSQESQDDLERPLLEWLHHAGCSEALQDQLDAEENDQCITIQVDLGSALRLTTCQQEALLLP